MPEILIVGGLTIDRFAGGETAPGGSVIHAGLAAVAEGAALSILTIAGGEPEAREGLDRLAGLGRVVCQPSARTTTYRHDESSGHRVLVYEAASATIDLATSAEALGHPDVVLAAPIADELETAAVAELRAGAGARLTVLLVQGWLRRLRLGEAVVPMTLDEVPESRWRAFGQADAVVLSVEDLGGEPADPFAQAAALRQRLGPGPILVLTLGTEGWVLDDPAADRIVAAVPRRVVSGAPTVGAGDSFGAAMALHLAAGEPPLAAAEAGTERVIALLESRLASDDG